MKRRRIHTIDTRSFADAQDDSGAGALEALMQYFLGGISKLSGGAGLSEKAINNLSHIDNALVRYIGTMGINIASEVGEEELQLFLEPLIKAAVTGEEYDAPTWQSMLETAISTAISTGVLEVGNTTAYRAPLQQNIDNASSSIYNNTTRNGGEAYGTREDGNRNLERSNGARPLYEGYGSSNEGGRLYGRGNSFPAVSHETRRVMDESGIVNVELRDSSNDNAAFCRSLDEAKASNPYGAFVDSHTPEDLQQSGAKTFLASNGLSGVAVESNGNITGVFKNPNDRRGGVVNDLLITAIENGGDRLDCFVVDGKTSLARMYTRLGFIPVARLPFDPTYYPDWDYETFGRPDVIVMMHNGDSAQDVARKAGTYPVWSSEELKSLPTFTDYGKALEYRNNLIEQRKQNQTTLDPVAETFDQMNAQKNATQEAIWAAQNGVSTEQRQDAVNAEDSVGAKCIGSDLTNITKYAKFLAVHMRML